jgi:hypothetical protein
MTETRPQAGPDRGQSAGARRPPPLEPDAPTIGDWLHIEHDGQVIVYSGKTEVGQNIRTSLAQAVAEELRLPVSAIDLVLADTACTPYDMGTVGSRTTPVMARRLHQVAAATRELLLDLAAARWQVERGQLRLADGKILHDPTGRAISFGELTQGQRLTQEYDETAPVTPADQVDDRRHLGCKSRWLGDRHRRAPVHSRSAPPGYAGGQSAARASVWRQAARARHQRGGAARRGGCAGR